MPFYICFVNILYCFGHSAFTCNPLTSLVFYSNLLQKTTAKMPSHASPYPSLSAFLQSGITPVPFPSVTHPSCPISLNLYTHEDHPIRIRRCRHVFGRTCLEIWLQAANTCPLCRATLYEIPSENERGSSWRRFLHLSPRRRPAVVHEDPGEGSSRRRVLEETENQRHRRLVRERNRESIALELEFEEGEHSERTVHGRGNWHDEDSNFNGYNIVQEPSDLSPVSNRHMAVLMDTRERTLVVGTQFDDLGHRIQNLGLSQTSRLPETVTATSHAGPSSSALPTSIPGSDPERSLSNRGIPIIEDIPHLDLGSSLDDANLPQPILMPLIENRSPLITGVDRGSGVQDRFGRALRDITDTARGNNRNVPGGSRCSRR